MSTTSRIRRGRRQARIAAGALTLIVVSVAMVLSMSPPGIAAGVEDTAPPSATITPESETTVPDQTTTPSTEPGEPTVSTTAAAPSSGDSVDTDDGSTTAITVVGIIAALGVLLLAVWWMLRRTDEPRPPTDPDWPDRSEVI